MADSDNDRETGFEHRTVMSSGVRIHTVCLGQGRPVVMVHGFPESWYSWRHQMQPLADAGFRAIAIDVRGYGRSASPPEIGAYSMTALVGDVVAVLTDALADSGHDTGLVFGHDWGAPIAWNTALLRPDLVTGVAGLSVPYSPRGDVKPLTAFRAMAGDEQLFYIEYFQEPGVAEAEGEADLEGWLRGFYFTASAESDHTAPSMGMVPNGHQLRERLQQPGPGQMAWLSDDDLAFYVGEFERSGLAGPLNRYRNIDNDFDELAAWRHAPITVPALFIGGDRDGPTQLGKTAISRFGTNLPNLTKSVILDNCGHWVQQEQPEATNQLLVEFATELG